MYLKESHGRSKGVDMGGYGMASAFHRAWAQLDAERATRVEDIGRVQRVQWGRDTYTNTDPCQY